jgi:very-short-patch-repair endonuclease
MANARARELRKSMTEGEEKLWRILRYKQLGGLRFRRQQPIGPYIVDFFCPSAKLVIEVDGEPHTDETRMRRDAVRTRWLQEHGCRVIRFWNIEVFKYPDEVANTIARLAAAPHPSRPR